MSKIKMLKTSTGASDGITVNIYARDCIYPSDDIPLSEDLKNVFLGMGVAKECFDESVTEIVEPPRKQVVEIAPKKKAPKIQNMNKKELREFIESEGLEIGDDNMTKKDLFEIAKDIVDDNS